MWSLLYRPASSSLTKRDKVDPIAKQTSLRRIRHLVERNLGLAITEPMEKDPSEIHSVRVAGGPTASCPVEGWRTPRTLTTLSWCDGTLSRGFVTCREDSITEDQRHQANKAQVFLLCYHLLSVLICALRFVKFFCYNRLSIWFVLVISHFCFQKGWFALPIWVNYIVWIRKVLQLPFAGVEEMDLCGGKAISQPHMVRRDYA